MADIFEQHPQSPAESRPRVTIPKYRDRFWEREQQLVTQRALLERLRHKHYKRAGTLSHVMQRLGNWGRRNIWWLGALVKSMRR